MTIDRAKGIIAKSMPEYWYRTHPNLPDDTDTQEITAQKEFNLRITAAKKPLFMIYVYPSLRKEYNDYIKSGDLKVSMLYGNLGIHSVEELRNHYLKTNDMIEFLRFYDMMMPVSTNNCLVNRIARLFNDEFRKLSLSSSQQPEFDSSIMKSGVGYSKVRFNEISKLYDEYKKSAQAYKIRQSAERIDKNDAAVEHYKMLENFKEKCVIACPNQQELCDIVIDLCYRGTQTKQFAWDICGDEIIKNLVSSSNTISFPVEVNDNEEFEYAGHKFVMHTMEANKGDVDAVDGNY